MSNPIVWFKHLKLIPRYFPNFYRYCATTAATALSAFVSYRLLRRRALASRVQNRDIEVSGLYVYPIKSCRGYSVDEITIDNRGFVNDRRYMVVDATGRFVSQRKVARMALISPSIHEGPDWPVLILEAPGAPRISVPRSTSGEVRSVGIWNDTCEGIDQGIAAADWLSNFLDVPNLRLVLIKGDTDRKVDLRYNRDGVHQVAFQDGFPFLITSTASLEDLNKRMGSAVPMDRFRASIVVKGDLGAWEEDLWRAIRIGSVPLLVCKPCSRCKIPSIDQDTAAEGDEPSVTLKQFRSKKSKHYFGQNALAEGTGTLRVGDKLTVVSIGPSFLTR